MSNPKDPHREVLDWLDRRGFWSLIDIAVLLLLFRFAKTLACAGVSCLYGLQGNLDLMAVWMILAVLFIPERPLFLPRPVQTEVRE